MRRTRTQASGSSKKRRTGRPSGSRGRMRLSRSMYKQPVIYHFRRNCILGEILSTTVIVAGTLTFMLGHLPNYAEFTALFDQYRINKVFVKFTPTANQLNINTAPATVTVPTFYTVTDYDSSNNPSAVDEMLQYSTVKSCPGNKSHARVLVPRTATPVYRGVTAAYLQNPARQWLDCGYTDVPHYGLRYLLTGSLANYSFVYRVEATFYISCKSLR